MKSYREFEQRYKDYTYLVFVRRYIKAMCSIWNMKNRSALNIEEEEAKEVDKVVKQVLEKYKIYHYIQPIDGASEVIVNMILKILSDKKNG